MVQTINKTSSDTPQDKKREINYEYNRNLVNILEELQISLFFSTYQAGKLGVIGTEDSNLKIDFYNFERAMGIAINPTQMAVGGKNWVYLLKNDSQLAPQIDPPGSYDACFLTRGAQYTGDVSIHDLAWGSKELWMVNTRFSCLCTLSNNYNFLPQWRPNFISAIAAEDRCHLNGVAMVGGIPKYVTVLGKTDSPGGWRENKATGGCILEVPSSRVVTEGLSMPHSPRIYGDRLWTLNSGYGELVVTDLASGTTEKIISLPGYTRGLAFFDRYAFIGLSKIRETAIFGDLPIRDRLKDEIKCGIGVVDLPNKSLVGCLEFSTGVDEIFDLQIAPFAATTISGPHVMQDEAQEIWSLPASAAI